MYCTRNASFFPRFAHSEFAQVARLLDEVAQFPNTAWGRSVASNNSHPHDAYSGFRTFQPRFDVKESKEAYELTGELPGVSDINVEFTDATTLTIKGRTTHSREEGTRPAGLVAAKPATEAQPEMQPEIEPAKTSAEWDIVESETSSTYHKASVEDEDHVATPADSTAGEAAVPTPESATEKPELPETSATPQAQNQSKYWLSERSVGEFSRTFTFPARVDQDAVKASLKDGILSVVVPKAAPATRRINVQ